MSANGASRRRIGDGPRGATTIVGVPALVRRLYALAEQGEAWLGTALP